MQNLTKYLLETRKSLGYSQAKLAKELGIPQTTWASYEIGKAKPPIQILIKLAQMGYPYSELVTNTKKEVLDELSNQTGLPPEEIERRRLEQVKGLPPDTPLDKLPAPDYKKTSDEVRQGGFIVPLLDQSLSAGKGQPLPEDDTPAGYVAVPKELRRYGDKLAALYVNGDSMEPTLQRGDLVVCDSCGWDGEGIYALRMDGCGYVKRLAKKPGKLVVISDNPKYEPWEEPDESQAVSIIGRVHYALKRVD